MQRDPFFIPVNKRRSRGTQNKQPKPIEKPQQSDTDSDDNQHFDVDEMDLEHKDDLEDRYSDMEDPNENAQEKRIRLSMQYIETVKQQQDSRKSSNEVDAREIDRDLVAERLKQDAMESVGKLQFIMADKVKLKLDADMVKAESLLGRNQHRLSVTSVAVTPDNKFVFSAGKDGVVIKFDLEERKKVHTFPHGKRRGEKPNYSGHTDSVLTMSISQDGQFLATGGCDKKICIWSVKTNELLHTFMQHRDSVTGLVFRRGGDNTLYSASTDRTIKVFNIDGMAYVETLFGHQDVITALADMGVRERCLTTGGRDRSVRMWKILDESQLVFRFSAQIRKPGASLTGAQQMLCVDETGSLDCVAHINDDTWVTGSDGGTLAIWSVHRKKPIFALSNAHGRIAHLEGQQLPQLLTHENAMTFQGMAISHSTPNWITALAAAPNADMLVSGSSDGHVRFWKYVSSDDESRRPHLKFIGSVEVKGFVNSLTFSSDLNFLFIGVGQEQKMGRWGKITDGARNGVYMVDLGDCAEPRPGH